MSKVRTWNVGCAVTERKRAWITVTARTEKDAMAKAEYKVGCGEEDDYKVLDESVEAFCCEEVKDQEEQPRKLPGNVSGGSWEGVMP